MSKFHFIKNQKTTLIIVAVILIAGLASFLIRGFNIDIDFSGGTEIKLDIGTEATSEVCDNINNIIRNNEKLGNEYVSSTTKSSDNSNMVIIRTGTAALDNEQTLALQDAILEAYPESNLDKIEITTIQPTIGDSLTKKAILAVAVAVVLMLVYISIRFEFKSGIAAVFCLCHDLFVMFAVYSLFQIPINSNIIAALLTILGYSINATIVVFDRIRELRATSPNVPFADLVNDGIHSTFFRSVNTTLTTLFTIGMIYILGVESIKDFAFPLIVGIVAGLFSSVFMAGMLWNMFNNIGKKSSK